MKKIFFVFVVLLIWSCAASKTPQMSSTAIESLTEEQIFNITAEPKDFPLILRRTTLIVRDIKTSLELYRDALGMEVIYDNIIMRPRRDGKEGEQQLRLVFLKATQEYVGVLGLLEYYYGEEREEKPIRKEGFTAQNIVLLFNSQNVKDKFEKLRNIESIEILEEPELTEYPSYDGKTTIRVLTSTFYDPDGFLVEFNELLDSL